MRRVSSSVPMPFSVTITGQPLMRAASRMVCSSASGWNSYPICVRSAPSPGGPTPFAPAQARALCRDHHQNVGFVDRANVADDVAQPVPRPLAIAREAIDGFGILPAAVAREPQRRGEMMEGDHRHDVRRAACRNHAPIVIERSLRIESFLRLDARPLNGKTIGAKAKPLEQRDVLFIAMVMVA